MSGKCRSKKRSPGLSGMYNFFRSSLSLFMLWGFSLKVSGGLLCPRQRFDPSFFLLRRIWGKNLILYLSQFLLLFFTTVTFTTDRCSEGCFLSRFCSVPTGFLLKFVLFSFVKPAVCGAFQFCRWACFAIVFSPLLYFLCVLQMVSLILLPSLSCGNKAINVNYWATSNQC